MKTTIRQGYIIIETPHEEEDIITVKETLDEDNDDSINSIEMQGNKLVIGVQYEDIEEVAQVASNIIYNCISQEIYSITIKYCGKEINTSTNRKTKQSYNSLSSHNSRNTSFDSYIRGSLTM